MLSDTLSINFIKVPPLIFHIYNIELTREMEMTVLGISGLAKGLGWFHLLLALNQKYGHGNISTKFY